MRQPPPFPSKPRVSAASKARRRSPSDPHDFKGNPVFRGLSRPCLCWIDLSRPRVFSRRRHFCITVCIKELEKQSCPTTAIPGICSHIRRSTPFRSSLASYTCLLVLNWRFMLFFLPFSYLGHCLSCLNEYFEHYESLPARNRPPATASAGERRLSGIAS